MGKKEITVYEFWRLTDYERDELVRKKYGWGYDKFVDFCREMMKDVGPIISSITLINCFADIQSFYYCVEPEEVSRYFELNREETGNFESQWLVENNASALFQILYPICKFLLDGWGLIILAFGELFWFIYLMYQLSFNGLRARYFLLLNLLGLVAMFFYVGVVQTYSMPPGGDELHDKKLKQYLKESSFGKFRDSLYRRAYNRHLNSWNPNYVAEQDNLLKSIFQVKKL